MAGSSSSIRPANGRTKFPFSGPHFGKALDTVIKDRLDVALWFLKDRERCAAYPDIANYLVAATKGRVSDSKTPRHNRAQLDFLDRSFLNAFMECVMDDSEWYLGWIGNGYAERARVKAVPESMFGWDLYIEYGCHCGDPDCDSEYHAGEGTVAVEIKPVISDKREIKGKVIEDPASILRQINRQRNVTGARSIVLYAEDINCAAATRMEIERYFDAANVRLITLDDVSQKLVDEADRSGLLTSGGDDGVGDKFRLVAKFAHDLAFECSEICFDGINSNVDMYKFTRLAAPKTIRALFADVSHAFIHHFVKDAIDHRGDRKFRFLSQEGIPEGPMRSLPEVSRAMSNMLRGIA